MVKKKNKIMDKIIFYIHLVILTFLKIHFINTQLASNGQHVCRTFRSTNTRVSYRGSYTAYTSYRRRCGWWSRCRGYSAYTAYRTAYRTQTNYYWHYYCCTGWARRGNSCPIALCSPGCSHGTCVRPNQCQCSRGYYGNRCQHDNNECSSKSSNNCAHNCINTLGSFRCSCRSGYRLYNGRSCTDINECSSSSTNNCQHNCRNTIGSYRCSCRSGYRLINGRSCSDINECLSRSTHSCQHNCINTAGSYRCSCHSGYRLHSNRRSCQDINECSSSSTNNCQHNCINTIGSYRCSCRSGYRLINGRSCSDINECLSRSMHSCQHNCINTAGSYRCSCHSGYRLHSNGRSCQDINECSSSSTNNCQHNCRNTIGSYICSCRSGYRLTNGRSCIDINECSGRTHGCAHNCINTPGSYRCSCYNGYRLATNGRLCHDINECSSGLTNNCQQICTNTVGAYRCSCHNGYRLTNGRTCNDINECSSRSTHSCQHNCINNIGSYRCSCQSGYGLDGNGRSCRDINECSSGLTNNCQHNCINIIGTYRCSCRNGYRLTNRRSCNDIDECSLSTLNNCQHFCHNTDGAYYCTCRQGYSLQTNGQCVDINECSSKNLNTCQQNCHNVAGSYRCSCNDGFTLHDDGTCTDINECNNDGLHDCQHYCHNEHGSYSCSCFTGYRLNADESSCSDINECISDSTNTCEHFCHNTIGSYTCSCRNGYNLQDNGNCTDINECSSDELNTCEQYCHNTIGSYRCSCMSGFTLQQNGSCYDINECSSDELNICEHNCHNRIGSYRCSCRAGFRLNTDGSCHDINECSSDDLNTCEHFCHNTIGSYNCSCRAGFTLQQDGSCNDINECSSHELNTCEHNCHNTIGSYRCSCRAGFTLNTDGSCHDINECSSDDLNTCEHFCHNTIGSYNCSCRAGFTLQQDGSCNDINECSSHELNTCEHNCHNNIGSYNCSCRAGFTLQQNGSCHDINECSSDELNTCEHNCHNTIGSYNCSCRAGFTLLEDGSCSDINECASNSTHTCEHFCHNTIGSYTCSCRNGYNLQDNGNCTDINECLSDELNTCEHNCHNNIGSYNCSCRDGYTLHQNGSCHDNNECTSDTTNTCEHFCHNTIGSYDCSCKDGFTLHKNGSCSDINECKSEDTNECEHFCHNTIGSYNCSCEDGYQLTNGSLCLDINECSSDELNTCEHNCNNTIGSYRCSCRAGFTLHKNGSCDGLPCEKIISPPDGSLQCSGYVTEESCNVTCDNGYYLIGTNRTYCMPSDQWSGPKPYCKKRLCDEFKPLEDTSVVIPCGREFETICLLQCPKGYFLDGQAFVRCDAINNVMVWRGKKSQCQQRSACEPNPCLHDGNCILTNETSSLFRCDCYKTSYYGTICSNPVGTLTSYTRAIGLQIEIRLVVRADPKLTIKLFATENLIFVPAITTVNLPDTTAVFKVIAKKPGSYKIHYEIIDTDGDGKSIGGVNLQFLPEDKTTINEVVDIGLNFYQQNCFSRVLSRNVSLVSSCNWNNSSTNGITSIRSPWFHLPVSVVGVRDTAIDRFNEISEINTSEELRKFFDDGKIGACSELCNSSSNLNPNNIDHLLKNNFFSLSYIKEISKNLPEWFQINVDLKLLTFSKGNSLSKILNGTTLQSIKSCRNLPIDETSVYSVYTAILPLVINLVNFQGVATSILPMCIAVDLLSEHVLVDFSKPIVFVDKIQSNSVIKRLDISKVSWNINNVNINGVLDFKMDSFSGNFHFKGNFVIPVRTYVIEYSIVFEGILQYRINMHFMGTTVLLKGTSNIMQKLSFSNEESMLDLQTNAGTIMDTQSIKFIATERSLFKIPLGISNNFTNTTLNIKQMKRQLGLLQSLNSSFDDLLAIVNSKASRILVRKTTEFLSAVTECQELVTTDSVYIFKATLCITKLKYITVDLKAFLKSLSNNFVLSNSIHHFEKTTEQIHVILETFSDIEIIADPKATKCVDKNSFLLKYNGSICIHNLCFHQILVTLQYKSNTNEVAIVGEFLQSQSLNKRMKITRGDKLYLVMKKGTNEFYGNVKVSIRAFDSVSSGMLTLSETAYNITWMSAMGFEISATNDLRTASWETVLATIHGEYKNLRSFNALVETQFTKYMVSTERRTREFLQEKESVQQRFLHAKKVMMELKHKLQNITINFAELESQYKLTDEHLNNLTYILNSNLKKLGISQRIGQSCRQKPCQKICLSVPVCSVCEAPRAMVQHSIQCKEELINATVSSIHHEQTNCVSREMVTENVNSCEQTPKEMEYSGEHVADYLYKMTYKTPLAPLLNIKHESQASLGVVQSLFGLFSSCSSSPNVGTFQRMNSYQCNVSKLHLANRSNTISNCFVSEEHFNGSFREPNQCKCAERECVFQIPQLSCIQSVIECSRNSLNIIIEKINSFTSYNVNIELNNIYSLLVEVQQLFEKKEMLHLDIQALKLDRMFSEANHKIGVANFIKAQEIFKYYNRTTQTVLASLFPSSSQFENLTKSNQNISDIILIISLKFTTKFSIENHLLARAVVMIIESGTYFEVPFKLLLHEPEFSFRVAAAEILNKYLNSQRTSIDKNLDEKIDEVRRGPFFGFRSWLKGRDDYNTMQHSCVTIQTSFEYLNSSIQILHGNLRTLHRLNLTSTDPETTMPSSSKEENLLRISSTITATDKISNTGFDVSWPTTRISGIAATVFTSINMQPSGYISTSIESEKSNHIYATKSQSISRMSSSIYDIDSSITSSTDIEKRGHIYTTSARSSIKTSISYDIEEINHYQAGQLYVPSTTSSNVVSTSYLDSSNYFTASSSSRLKISTSHITSSTSPIEPYTTASSTPMLSNSDYINAISSYTASTSLLGDFYTTSTASRELPSSAYINTSTIPTTMMPNPVHAYPTISPTSKVSNIEKKINYILMSERKKFQSMHTVVNELKEWQQSGEINTMENHFQFCLNFKDCVHFAFDNLKLLPSKRSVTKHDKYEYLIDDIHKKFDTLFQNISNPNISYSAVMTIIKAVTTQLHQLRSTSLHCSPPPRIIGQTFKKLHYEVGNSVELFCGKVNSILPVKYYWRHNEIYIDGENTLFLRFIATTSKVGMYTCVVTSMAGSTFSAGIFVSLIQAPSIQSQPRSQVIILPHSSEEIVIVCNVTGFPKPNIKWFYRNFSTLSPIQLNETNELLVIRNFTGNETNGFYHCEASNDYGNVTSKMARIDVLSSMPTMQKVTLALALNNHMDTNHCLLHLINNTKIENIQPHIELIPHKNLTITINSINKDFRDKNMEQLFNETLKSRQNIAFSLSYILQHLLRNSSVNGTDSNINGTDSNTNGTNSSVNGTDSNVNGTDFNMNGTNSSANGTDSNINVTDSNTNGTNSSVNGTDSNINGTYSNTNGTNSSVNGTDSNVNGTDFNMNGTNSSVNGTDSNINGTYSNTNETNSSVNGTDSNVNGTDFNMNGTNPSVNETDSNTNGTNPSVNGTDSNINGTNSSVNGTDSNVDETHSNVNGTDANINGTYSNINGTDSSVNDTDSGMNGTDSNVNATDYSFNKTDSNIDKTNVPTKSRMKRSINDSMKSEATELINNGTDSNVNVTDNKINGTDSNMNGTFSNFNGTDFSVNSTNSTVNVTDISVNGTNYNVNGTDINVNGTDINFNGTNINVNGTNSIFNVTNINVNGTDSDVNVTNINVNGTNSSVNGTNININGTDSNVNGTNINVNGTNSSVNGTNININGTDSNVNGTNINVNGTNSSVNGTNININGTDSNVNGTNINVNGTDSNVNGTNINVNGTDSNFNGTNTKINGTDSNVSGIDTKIKCTNSNVNGPSKNINGTDNDIFDSSTLTFRTELDTCEPGYELHNNGFICVQCAAGSYSKDGRKCKACPRGTYQHTSGSVDCLKCDETRTTISTSGLSEIQCSVYINKPGASRSGFTKVEWILLIISICLFACFVIIVVVYCCCCRKRYMESSLKQFKNEGIHDVRVSNKLEDDEEEENEMNLIERIVRDEIATTENEKNKGSVEFVNPVYGKATTENKRDNHLAFLNPVFEEDVEMDVVKNICQEEISTSKL